MTLTVFAAPMLVVAGGCDTFESSRGAASLLQVVQGPTPTQATQWALDRYSPNNRYRGTMYLATQPWGGGPEYMQLYVDATQDTDAGVRAAGVRGLALHGDGSHVPLLIEALTDVDSIVRLDAARALQRIHEPSAVAPLLAAIRIEREDNELIRAESAHALGQYAERRVIDALIASFEDPSLGVNESARLSLRTLTGQDFGYDVRGWVEWTSDNPDVFLARSAYIYPAFWRDKRLIEWLPLVPQAPNEMASYPVGSSPEIP
jgi:hypothetical protein